MASDNMTDHGKLLVCYSLNSSSRDMMEVISFGNSKKYVFILPASADTEMGIVCILLVHTAYKGRCFQQGSPADRPIK